MNFEIIEHTGDVGIRYFGSTIEELFTNAVLGTAALIGDPEPDCKKETTELQIEFLDYVDLMYLLLGKLIYLFEVEETLYGEITQFNIRDNRAFLKLKGCKVTPKFQYKYIMKAPTYHKMEINLEKGYGVQIFDI